MSPMKKSAVVLLLCVGLVLLVGLDARLGRGTASWWADEQAWVTLTQLHLPRALAAVVAGGALALAGLLLQTVTDNPLAAPELLGISPGAVCAVMLGTGMSVVNPASPLSALGAALVGAVLGGVVSVLTTLSAGRDWAILGGLVLGAAATGLSMVMLASNPRLTGMAMRWLAGSTNALTWESVLPMAVWAAVVVLLFLPSAGILPLVGGGVAHSAVLGLSPLVSRLWLMVLACLLTSGAVALAGPLGFVGLAVPHVMRRLVGPASRWLGPATLAGGAVGMVACDAAAQGCGRLLALSTSSLGVPAGAMASLAGAATLLWLLRRRS